MKLKSEFELLQEEYFGRVLCPVRNESVGGWLAMGEYCDHALNALGKGKKSER